MITAYEARLKSEANLKNNIDRDYNFFLQNAKTAIEAAIRVGSESAYVPYEGYNKESVDKVLGLLQSSGYTVGRQTLVHLKISW